MLPLSAHENPAFAHNVDSAGVYETRDQAERKVTRLVIQERLGLDYYEKKYGRAFDFLEDLQAVLFDKPTNWVSQVEIDKIEPGTLYNFVDDLKYWDGWSLYTLLNMLMNYETGELYKPDEYDIIFPNEPAYEENANEEEEQEEEQEEENANEEEEEEEEEEQEEEQQEEEEEEEARENDNRE